MPIKCAAIMPHGFPLIPAVSDDAGGAMSTRSSLEDVGGIFSRHGVEVVVIVGPHGTRVDGAMAIVRTGRGAGALTWEDRTVEMNVPIDIPLADAIAEESRAAGVPVAMVGFAGNRDDQAVMPLDWGAMVPLWFTGHDRNLPGYGSPLSATPDDEGRPTAILITPSRKLPRSSMQQFGRAIAQACANDNRNIGFVASCDWAHTHREDGPYGYRDEAKPVDDFVLNAIRTEKLDLLMDLPEEDASAAAIDGMWQTLVLDGVLQEVPMKCTFRSYEVPAYYSMIVASYEPESDHDA